MSLVGRLDDLSLADIIQIVHLSRRTGTLEIVDAKGKHALIFLKGLVVDASSSALTPPGNARDRIVAIAQPLITSTEGEFTFHLSEDPKHAPKDGGLTPQQILGTSDKQKLKPLRGLEESLKAGKALITAVAPPVVESEIHPQVVVFDRNATMRVAIKRRFARERVEVAQFGTLEDTRKAIEELFAAKRFFVTVLERTRDGSAERLLHWIKGRNAQLTVMTLESRAGMPPVDADRRIIKPDLAEASAQARELAAFADDVVMSAQYALSEWTRLYGSDRDAARRFYEQGDEDSIARRAAAARRLISGLSDPDDVGQVATTVLRLLEDYVDRGALFIAGQGEFIGIGGFGANDMHRRVAALKLARSSASVLDDVAASLLPHHGKLRRTEGNIQLMQALAGRLPTEVVALPIVHDGSTLGVVYGDNAEHRVPIGSTSAVEVFLFHAADAFANALSAAQEVRMPAW